MRTLILTCTIDSDLRTLIIILPTPVLTLVLTVVVIAVAIATENCRGELPPFIQVYHVGDSIVAKFSLHNSRLIRSTIQFATRYLRFVYCASLITSPPLLLYITMYL